MNNVDLDAIQQGLDNGTILIVLIIMAIAIIAMVIKIIKNVVTNYINKRVRQTLKSRKNTITPAAAREAALTNFFYNRIEEDIEKTTCGTSANAIHLIKVNNEW